LAASAGVAAAAKTARARRSFFIVLESCSGGEVEKLGPIIAGLDIRDAHIDLQRPKGRTPAETEAGRGAECEIIFHARLLRARANDIVHPAQGTEIGEGGNGDTITFRQQRR